MKSVTLLAALLMAISYASAAPSQFLITPGVGIGQLKVGMNITEAVVILGTPKATKALQDGTMRYVWYEAVFVGTSRSTGGGSGLKVVTKPSGEIIRVYAHYDPQYVTAEGLHTGMTEAQVTAALGAPTRVDRHPEEQYHTLVYPGIAFLIPDDPQDRAYRKVGEIIVSVRG